MGIAILLLGLLPLLFLPDLLGGDPDPADAEPSLPPGQLPDYDDEPTNEISLLDDPDADSDVGDNTALTPIDEDDQPDDGTQPDPADILQPVDEDDVATPPDSEVGDVLQPVDQIETDANTIWINFDEDAGLGYSEIEDFQAGHDVLHVLIDPDSVVGALDVEVRPADDGLDALVFIEQQLVAILKGAPEATVADVIVEIGVISA